MQINGKELAVESEGEGPAIFMIHGLGGSSNTWFPQRRSLSSKFRVVCPDLHGSARSAVQGDVSIAGYVEDAVAVMDALEISAADFVGHSMGTIVCQHLAVEHPERVRSLVMMGPLLEPPDAARAAMADRAGLARKEGMVPIADTLLKVSISNETRAHKPEVCAMVRESLMRQDPEGYARSCEALAAAKAAPVQQIDCPTLLLSGDEDLVGPPAATLAIAEQIKGATMNLYANTGHWTPIERPTEVNEAMLNFYFGLKQGQ